MIKLNQVQSNRGQVVLTDKIDMYIGVTYSVLRSHCHLYF